MGGSYMSVPGAPGPHVWVLGSVCTPVPGREVVVHQGQGAAAGQGRGLPNVSPRRLLCVGARNMRVWGINARDPLHTGARSVRASCVCAGELLHIGARGRGASCFGARDLLHLGAGSSRASVAGA